MPVATAHASSHREAPFVTKSPKIDGTDFYAFNSYDPNRSGMVTFIANYEPLQDPFGGPNYFQLDDQAIYEISIDNTGDAIEDLTFQFKFTNALNGGTGIALPIGPSGNQQTVGIPLINDGDATAAASSNTIETYTLGLITGPRRGSAPVAIKNATTQSATFSKPTDFIGEKSFGSTDAYNTYANAHIFPIAIPNCATNGQVFVGQRAESFSVNLGVIFDLVNAPAATVIGGATEAGRGQNAPGNNVLAGKNITTIALEVPASCIKGSTDVIGAWTTASVRQARVINPTATYALPAKEGGAWTQVSRLGMPLVNEVVIGLADKDRWNSSEPKNDAQFANYVEYPTLPALLEVLFGSAGVHAPTKFPRTDLVAAFLTGVPGVNGFPSGSATAEYVRLNIGTSLGAPTAKGSQNDLGAAACFVMGTLTPSNAGCDPSGFPNGRRPGDDVTDIELRVAMGYLLTTADAPSGQLNFTDGAWQNDSQFLGVFPYLNTPYPGAKNPQ